ADHGLETGHHILDVPGEKVPVVRQAVGERRTVVEDELVFAVLPCRARLDRCPESVIGGPVGQDVLLDGGQRRGRGDLTGSGVPGIEVLAGHSGAVLRIGLAFEEDPHPGGSVRGTNSFAAWGRFVPAVTGPPVRFY